jgi:hypothetical protein
MAVSAMAGLAAAITAAEPVTNFEIGTRVDEALARTLADRGDLWVTNGPSIADSGQFIARRDA